MTPTHFQTITIKTINHWVEDQNQKDLNQILHHIMKYNIRNILLVDDTGIEPALQESESRVLSLDESPKSSFELCGGSGIRTPDTFQYNGFQDRRIRPLCLTSDYYKYTQLNSNIKDYL